MFEAFRLQTDYAGWAFFSGLGCGILVEITGLLASGLYAVSGLSWFKLLLV